MKDFSGKHVVITGAASGIGRALAHAFVAEGAKVALTDIDQDGLDKVVADLNRGRECARGYRVDNSSEEETRVFAARVLEDFGHADVVCANAGVAEGSLFEKSDMDKWRWLMGINFWGVAYTLRYLVPSMVERGQGGSLLITSSGAGLVPGPGMASYHASKAAVLSLGETLHAELEPYGIGVSVLCPGIIQTAIAEHAQVSFGDAETDRFASRNSREKYAKEGVPPSVVAADALKGLRRNQLVIPSPRSHVLVGWLLHRLSPSLFSSLVLKPRWRKGEMVNGVVVVPERAKGT